MKKKRMILLTAASFDGSGSRTNLGVLGPERFLFVMFFNMFFYSKFLKGLLFRIEKRFNLEEPGQGGQPT